MSKQLLSKEKNYYKANLHCHSTFSDGRKTPEEIKELYQKLGYSVVAYTDHDILIPHPELTDDSFLALNGFEIEVNDPNSAYKRTCHFCLVGIDPDNITQPCWHRSKYLFGHAKEHVDEVKFDESQPDFERAYTAERISEMMNIGREKGFFVTYNHPSWSRETYENYSNYSGMHAFEIFNGSCIASGFEDYNPRVYDDMLRNGKKIYCIGADDNHNAHPDDSRKSDSGVGFTVINADKLEYKTITQALLDGDFYASEGPSIYDLKYEDGKAYIECSDADRITCNYMTRKAEIAYAEVGSVINSAVFNVPDDCVFFRITVIDKSGKHACTNAYFVSDVKD